MLSAAIEQTYASDANGMSAPTAARPLFAAYSPSPLNDAAAPPFPGLEADEEDDTKAGRVDLDFERPQALWVPIARAEPPSDRPVRFIDGSIRSKTVGSIVVGMRRRPLIAAAVSAAALELDGRSLRRGSGARTAKVLAVHSNGMDAGDLREAFHALAGAGVKLLTSEVEAQGDFDTLRRTTRSIAMLAMEEAERDVMLADMGTPTLMDGLLERRLAAQRHDVPVAGLVKRQMATYLPAGLQELTYSLQPGERTPAFVLDTPQHVTLVNTYVRLSSQTGASPSYGIVRLTAPLEYVEREHRNDLPAYLSGLAGYLYRIRCRDQGYTRSGISVEPIVRCEDHLHAILPDLEALVPKLHRMFRAGA
jgi:hypothetical protein